MEKHFETLECCKAWDALKYNEKMYAFYMAKASWEGAKICLFQRSYESPALFLIFQKIFSMERIETVAKSKGVSASEWEKLLIYASCVYANLGNYTGFGDSKILPEVSKDKFDLMISAANCKEVRELWGTIGNKVYENEPKRLGFSNYGGCSSYYSPNIESSDAEFINRFLQSIGASELQINSRLCKTENGFTIKIASMRNHPLKYLGNYEYEGQRIAISNGDFHLQMKCIVNCLSQALPYVSNPSQETMLINYIKHFTTGDILHHRDSQINWVSDKSPVVECNLGFVERYADPLGRRAEFQGFVSIIDQTVSTQLSNLVARAKDILFLLPWSPRLTTFIPPDFTSLNVINFVSSSIPIGINIPNYDDIRLSEGFKNMTLTNVYAKPTVDHLLGLSTRDCELLIKNHSEGTLVTVALHELFGHGNTEQYINRDYDLAEKTVNTLNGDLDLYVNGASWEGRFGTAYEECKAEAVALYLSTFETVYHILGIHNSDEVMKTVWLSMAYKGLLGLLHYDPTTKQWGQSHCWARYIIFRVLLDSTLISLSRTPTSFAFSMDFSKLKSIGFSSVSVFLFSIFSINNTPGSNPKHLFNYYSEVSIELLSIRSQLLNDPPLVLRIQPNISYTSLISYPETCQGLIQSFQDRFPPEDPSLLSYWLGEYFHYLM